MSAPRTSLPRNVREALAGAKRLEWITIAYLASAIVLLALVMSGSQAMKTAWIDDLFSLVPPIAFLVSRKIAERKPSAKFPYGLAGASSIAYLASAIALFGMGLFLSFDALRTLATAERPTIGAMRIFGKTVWAGYPMLVVLVWSGVPAFFIGRAKKRYAGVLKDEGLVADAKISEADWQTAAAAMLGIVGIGCGLWWADGAAALLIALDIVRDALKSLRRATNDILDRKPRDVLDPHGEDDEINDRIADELSRMSWVADSEIRLRKEGAMIIGEVLVVPARRDDIVKDAERTRAKLRALDWRVLDVVIAPVSSL
jgi:divalent metal cation (Fe/Co/Zn/Cd) transporter